MGEVSRLRLELTKAFRRIEDLENDNERFDDLAKSSVVAIESIENGRYRVHQWTQESICPQSEYPNARLAASRVLQLLGVGPVAPQTHPESVCIGSVELEDEG